MLSLIKNYPPFLRFCMVGAVGFIVDTGLCELGVQLELSATLARVASMAMALLVTFLLHQQITFPTHHIRFGRLLYCYLTANLLGAAINYAAFWLILSANENTLIMRLIAIISGTMLGLVLNFWATKQFVFRKEEAPHE